MRVTLLDYGMGNLRSVTRALEAAGADVSRQATVGDGPLVLPGVGAFGRAAENLRGQRWDALREHVARGRPLLGICLGMQLCFESSDEHGEHQGLGFLSGQVRHLGVGITVPNMGWHRLAGLGDPWAYFAHSYGVRQSPDAVAHIDHGGAVVAAARRDNVLGFQFHPEKSGTQGVALIKEWLRC